MGALDHFHRVACWRSGKSVPVALVA